MKLSCTRQTCSPGSDGRECGRGRTGPAEARLSEASRGVPGRGGYAASRLTVLCTLPEASAEPRGDSAVAGQVAAVSELRPHQARLLEQRHALRDQAAERERLVARAVAGSGRAVI